MAEALNVVALALLAGLRADLPPEELAVLFRLLVLRPVRPWWGQVARGGGPAA